MMELKVYNSLHRQKEVFKTLEPQKVKMYVCGPTVYNYLHVGNFRGPVVYNLIRNWLEFLGYQVTYALNFTDVDDKIIDRANQEGVTAEALTEKYIQAYIDDFKALGLRPHEHNPRVTTHMQQILDMVSSLIQQGKAYVVEGDVYFSVETFSEYGKLSGRVTEDLIAGARVDVDPRKKHPNDFALWKAAKLGEPSWNSPWGPGRPGWHIECSAMVKSLFGNQIDIHGGGSDLMFPHHENEIAQSEGCNGDHYVSYWLHTAMLNISGQKMSKSLGNIISLRDFLVQQHPEVYKWMILSSHYRSVSDFGDEAVVRATKSLAKIYSGLAVAEDFLTEDLKSLNFSERLHQLRVQFDFKKSELATRSDLAKNSFYQSLLKIWKQVESSMNDDFNTPEVVAHLYEALKLFNSQVKWGMKFNEALTEKAKVFVYFISELGQMMALFKESPNVFLTNLDQRLLSSMNITLDDVEKIVALRKAAREQKDFKKSDEYRDQLLAMGISVMDSPLGTRWEVTK